MSVTTEEKKSSPIHSLIRDRKLAFASLVRAYLKFNVPHAKKIEVLETENRDIMILINDNIYKFDVSDYTGSSDYYIFLNPSSGRIVIEGKGVSKIYKLDVNLVDHEIV